MSLTMIVLLAFGYAAFGGVVGGFVYARMGMTHFFNDPAPLFSALVWPLALLVLAALTTAKVGRRIGEWERAKHNERKLEAKRREVELKRLEAEQRQIEAELESELVA